MSLKSGQSITVDFTTQNTSGAATDAYSTPTGTLVVNGTDNAATVTVTNKSTGNYKAAVTLPTLSAGDVVQLRIAATIGSTAAKAIIFQGVADTERISDLNDLTAAQVNAEVDTALADYDPPTKGELDSAVSPLATAAALATVDSIVDTIVARVIGTIAAGTHNPQSGDAYARLGSPAGASVIADLGTATSATQNIVLAVKAKTDNLPVAPAATGDIAAAIAAYDPPTKAELDSAVSPLATAALLATTDGKVDSILEDTGTTLPGNLSTLQSTVEGVNTNIGIAGAGLTTLATAAALEAVDDLIDTEVAAVKAVTDKLDTAIELDGAVYRLTTNALEQAPASEVALTPEQIAEIAAGISINPQDIRDSMKLAPTTGAAAGGSVDRQLAEIAASIQSNDVGGSGASAYEAGAASISKADVIALFGSTTVNKWADIDTGGTVTADQRLALAVEWGSATVEARLRGSQYDLANVSAAGMAPIRHAMAVYAAWWLRGGRPIDKDKKDHVLSMKREVDKWLTAVCIGDSRLDEDFDEADGPGMAM